MHHQNGLSFKERNQTWRRSQSYHSKKPAFKRCFRAKVTSPDLEVQPVMYLTQKKQKVKARKKDRQSFLQILSADGWSPEHV